MRTYRLGESPGSNIKNGLGMGGNAGIWMLLVPGRFCSVDGVSVAPKGVSEAKIQKSFSRDPQQSVRFQICTPLTVAEAPKSTCHQAFTSAFVAVTEPLKKFP